MPKSKSTKEHYSSSPIFNPDTNKREERYKAVGAWFLGAKAENKELFQECVQQSITQHADHRKNLYEEDPEYIDESIKESSQYKQEVENIKKFQKELQERLQLSVPFFSNRYQGHMNWDTVLPANIGYITAMLYNQNNVATEASSVTSLLEKEVGSNLCQMIGYKETTSWGHITADGTIANIEAMWASRNLKFYPLALVEAIKKTKKLREAENILLTVYDEHGNRHNKNLGECSSWQLLNLDCDEILLLSEKIKNICQVEEKFLYKVISPYLVQNVGLADFLKTHSINSPKIIVSATKHYSWPKAATLLGIGQNNVINVDVDDTCRMDTLKLQAQLSVCAAEKTPILMVVAVIGTTEEGVIDDLDSIIKLKSFQGLNFIVHCDAAWGGYLKTMMIDSKQRDLPLEESYVKSLPLSAYARKQFQCLSQADTITIDPHKAGFIPYPAGSLCYKNHLLRYLININAAYIHSSENIAMGMFGLEGSKPGAAAAAVWLAHKTIPLDISGYGQILGECNFTTKLYYCYWLTLAEPGDDFSIEPLIPLPKKISLPSGKSLELEAEILAYIRSDIIDKTNEQLSQNHDSISFLQQIGSDALINAFVVNYRKNGVFNKSLNNINNFNERLFDKFSITGRPDENVKDKELIITSTKLESKNYFIPLKRMADKLELNISKEFSIQVIINTILQPWPTTHNFIKHIMNCFKDGIKSCIEEMPKYLDDSVLRIPVDNFEEPSDWIDLDKNSYAGYAEIGYDLCVYQELEATKKPKPNKIYFKYKLDLKSIIEDSELCLISSDNKKNKLKADKIYLQAERDGISYVFKDQSGREQKGWFKIEIQGVLDKNFLTQQKLEILKNILAINQTVLKYQFLSSGKLIEGRLPYKAITPESLTKSFLNDNKDELLEIIIKQEQDAIPQEYKENRLFYWFFESKCTSTINTPIIIWLNGGPGASSLVGLFLENGPFTLNEDATISPNEFSWHEKAHMLFWDQPLGTGYSNCFNDKYVKSEEELSIQFVNALENFYKKHPNYAANPIYLAGESYAGKYIPYIAREILNRKNKIINLKGLAIGNGWMDPKNHILDQINYAYMLGIIDTTQKNTLLKQHQNLSDMIKNQKMDQAFILAQQLSNDILKCGGRENIYDVRSWKESGILDKLKKYLSSNSVKESVNISTSVNWEFADASGPVADNLIKDIMSCSVVNILRELINDKSLSILLYTGTFDMACGFTGTEKILREIGGTEWSQLSRAIWYKEEQGIKKTLGCIKQLDNVTQIEIPMSGHLVPSYQPKTSQSMIYNWINGNSFMIEQVEYSNTNYLANATRLLSSFSRSSSSRSSLPSDEQTTQEFSSLLMPPWRMYKKPTF